MYGAILSEPQFILLEILLEDLQLQSGSFLIVLVFLFCFCFSSLSSILHFRTTSYLLFCFSIRVQCLSFSSLSHKAAPSWKPHLMTRIFQFSQYFQSLYISRVQFIQRITFNTSTKMRINIDQGKNSNFLLRSMSQNHCLNPFRSTWKVLHQAAEGIFSVIHGYTSFLEFFTALDLHWQPDPFQLFEEVFYIRIKWPDYNSSGKNSFCLESPKTAESLICRGCELAGSCNCLGDYEMPQ